MEVMSEASCGDGICAMGCVVGCTVTGSDSWVLSSVAGIVVALAGGAEEILS